MNPKLQSEVEKHKALRAETRIQHQERLENSKKMHRLAVADKAPRTWYDKTRSNNGRTNFLFRLNHALGDLHIARDYYPDYAADQQMLDDLTKVRKAIRILAQRVAPDREYAPD